ncbi:MAG TPA: hypothetical protein VN812_22140 [Candidatus Acidoferrales bacterium]|nr:hypothetical protein [Candidatus Acidoferrales bacterium]
MAMVRWKNIENLVAGYGEVTIGRAGPVRCAAIATDELAALVRRPGEALDVLLARLDAAIEAAYNDQGFVDEINAPSGIAQHAGADRQGLWRET